MILLTNWIISLLSIYIPISYFLCWPAVCINYNESTSDDEDTLLSLLIFISLLFSPFILLVLGGMSIYKGVSLNVYIIKRNELFCSKFWIPYKKEKIIIKCTQQISLSIRYEPFHKIWFYGYKTDISFTELCSSIYSHSNDLLEAVHIYKELCIEVNKKYDIDDFLKNIP